MPMQTEENRPNALPTRDLWLQRATDALRPLFQTHGLALPDNIRFAIAFTSTGRRGKQLGETWHSPASADGAFEVILRADLAEPVAVLGVLVRQLVHAALPAEQSHGKRYKQAANRIGLQGKMREAVPNPYLQERLERLAAELPPLPHAALDINWRAVDKPRAQRGRMLKAECTSLGEGQDDPCGYTVRLSAKWASIGAVCPRHGPMEILKPEGADPDESSPETEEAPADAEFEMADAG
jgi:hypothetical protein